MKRILILLFMFVLLIPTAMGEGNKLLSIEDSDYVQNLFSGSDTLYISADTKLYTWHEGDDAPDAWDGEQIILSGDEGEENTALYEFVLYADADGLRGMRMNYDADYQPKSLRLYEIALENGAIAATQTGELPLPDALRSDFYPNSVCAWEGRLYLMGEGENGATLAVIDPANPKKAATSPLNSWDNALMPTKDGVLLAYYDYRNGDGGLTVARIGDDASLDTLSTLRVEGRLHAQTVAADAETGAIYAVIDGRVCLLDTAAGEPGEAVGALPVQPERCAMLGHSYVATLGGSVAVLDTAGRLDENAVLSIASNAYGEWLDKAIIAYSVEHPELAPVVSSGGYGALDDMIAQSPDTDIYMTGGYDVASYEAVLNRGYMAPLEDSETLTALAARFYPGFLKKLTHDGALVALPLRLDGSGMGLSKALLEKLGIDAADIPSDWPGFLDFMEDTLKPKLDQLGEKDQFVYDGLNAQDFCYFLRQRVLDDFLQASAAADVIPNYEDPRLLSVLERLEQIDFTEYGLPEKPDEEDGMGYGWSSDTHYLIQLDASYLFDNIYTDSLPLALGFGDDLPGVLSLRMSAAFVNPYSPHRTEAVTFLEALAQRLPDDLTYALCPDLSAPVRNPEADRVIASYEAYREQLQKEMDKADPADRQMLQEAMDRFAEEYEDYKVNGCWLISEEKLAWYRANAERLVVAEPSWFEKDTTGEAYQLLEQYNVGQLSAREFLAAVNRKARMMAMEEG